MKNHYTSSWCMGNAFVFFLQCLFLKYELFILYINCYHLILYQHYINYLIMIYYLFFPLLLPILSA